MIRFSLLSILLLVAPLSGAEPTIDYVRDVKPILRERCYSCHGGLKQESGLRLDTVKFAKKGGESGPAIVAGVVAKSLLVKRISASSTDDRMPPDGKPLTAQQIKTITNWIAQGAKAPSRERASSDPRSHWAFRKVQQPPVPVLHGARKAWNRNPIDAFVADQHRRHNVTPATQASKEVLLRRVYLDLIGLPPTRKQLHQFLNDKSANAYERVVDRLLDSPQYGERWGRHWMDVWRYSDWYGRRAANDVRNSSRQIWRWRDWIVRSLNEDKSYDRMIKEMLAGDEIAPHNPDVVVATGFIVRNCYRVNFHTWKQDMVEHTGKAFLGLTFNCALCHDHKYDPITHADYFRFRAFFEPLRLRHDRMPGEPDPGPYVEYDFHSNGHKPVRGGLARVYDGTLKLTTRMYRLGDARDIIKEKPPIAAGVPSFFGKRPLQIKPVKLPTSSWYPGIKPFIQKEETNKQVTAVRKVEGEVRALQQTSARLPKQLKQARAALTTAKRALKKDSNGLQEKTQALEAKTKLSATLAKQTVGHWQFEGKDSIDGFLDDSSSNGRALQRVTRSGRQVSPVMLKPNLFSSKPRQAARFASGSQAFLEAPGKPDLYAQNFTLQVVLNIASTRPGRNHTIADYEGSWWFYHRGKSQNTSELRLVLWNPKTDYLDAVTGSSANKILLKTGRDYYVAVVAGPVSVTFYVKELSKNAALQIAKFDRRAGRARSGGSADLTKLRRPVATTPLRIGNSVGGGGQLHADIDELRYFRRALPAAQVRTLAGGPGGSRQLAVRQAEQTIRDLQEQLDDTLSELNLAKTKLNHARLVLTSTQARIAADNARLKAKTGIAAQLAKVAFNSEQQVAVAASQVTLSEARHSLRNADSSRDVAKAKQQIASAEMNVVAAKKSLSRNSTSYKPLSKTFPKQSSGGRTALAGWIANKSNPLTARVAVNHIWLRHFGKPLVETVYDFGLNGKRPTHPKLLDWLAADFMNGGWKWKRLHRLIVTSRTYRLASKGSQKPNDNRYLTRFPKRRMEAEVVRDSLLHLAGSLDLTRGGKDIDPSLGESVNRRSLYFTIHPEDGMMRFMTVFNPPDPCDCYRRVSSVIPHQALAMTNSKIAVQQSRLLASRLWTTVLWETPKNSDRLAAFINVAFEQVLTRRPTKSEHQACRSFLREQIALFKRTNPKLLRTTTTKDEVPPASDPQLRALQSLLGVIFSHNDFLTIH